MVLAGDGARVLVMKVLRQILARAASRRSGGRLEQFPLHVLGQVAPNRGDRSAESCHEFVGSHWVTPLARTKALAPILTSPRVEVQSWNASLLGARRS